MRHTATLVGLWLISGVAQAAGPRVLTGRVYIGASAARPAAGFPVTRDGQDPTRTDSQGVFTIPLPSSRVPGKRIKLDVDKPGYCILYPPGGEVVVPEDLGEEKAVELRLLRSGSNPTRDCIANFIAEAANKAVRTAAKKDDPAGDASDNRSLREWAERHHLSAEQARAEIDRWVGEVKSRPDEDPYRRALAEYEEKKFDEAARLAGLAAEQEAKELAEEEKELAQRVRKAAEKRKGVVQRYQLAGDAEYAKQRFAAALEQYERALSYVSRAEAPELWADVLWPKGLVHLELGIRVAGEDAVAHLAAAATAIEQSLTVYGRDRHPTEWAALKASLSPVLHERGRRIGGEEGARLLGQAVAACRDALTVLTYKEEPQLWAITQTALGAALQEQGSRTGGEEGARLLDQAVAACRDALTVLTPKELPQPWALAQSTIGAALREQGRRTGGEEGTRLLVRAVASYRDALTVLTLKEQPLFWASTQNDLGLTLKEQGSWTGGEEGVRLLGEAISAYQAALTIFTLEEVPQFWASIQNNMGLALQEQGARKVGAERVRLLDQAVTAYRAALIVFTQKELPQGWAGTQTNLGSALQAQGIGAVGEEGARLLGEAVDAYRAAFTVFTREHLSQYWATAQRNLGDVLCDQGILATGDEASRLLDQAVITYRQALEVTGTFPASWTSEQRSQQHAYWAEEKLADCAAAFLHVKPDHFVAFSLAFSLDQERLFRFEHAFELLKTWFARHSKDLATQANFAEVHITTARFDAAHPRLTALLARTDIPLDVIVPVRALELIALVALDRTAKLPTKLQALRAAIASAPADFHLTWSFTGIKHFLNTSDHPTLTTHRTWLLDLIAAMEAKDRQSLLTALDILGQHLPAPQSQ